MISEFSPIEKLFEEIDMVLDEQINIYTIGGAVLLEQGLKIATKDIDLVVSTKNEFIKFQKALIKLEFKPQIPGKEYKHMNLNQIFQKEDFRIDLFEKEVCGKFSISEGMIGRARKIINLKYIKMHFCSNEDIFLFKTMTERDGDLEDCQNLMTLGLNWKVILEELKNQINNSKQDVWITWVGERLDLLENMGSEIDMMKDLNKLRNKYFEDLERTTSP